MSALNTCWWNLRTTLPMLPSLKSASNAEMLVGAHRHLVDAVAARRVGGRGAEDLDLRAVRRVDRSEEVDLDAGDRRRAVRPGRRVRRRSPTDCSTMVAPTVSPARTMSTVTVPSVPSASLTATMSRRPTGTSVSVNSPLALVVVSVKPPPTRAPATGAPAGSTTRPVHGAESAGEQDVELALAVAGKHDVRAALRQRRLVECVQPQCAGRDFVEQEAAVGSELHDGDGALGRFHRRRPVSGHRTSGWLLRAGSRR